MNQVITKKSDWNELNKILKEYFCELGYKNDGFHNSMIFDGEAHSICLNGKIQGFFSLSKSWENGEMLTGFYVCKQNRNKLMEIFDKIIDKMQVEVALVPSNDAIFLSLAFEKMNALKTTFDIQAFNFTYGAPSKPAEYGLEYVVELKPDEIQDMENLTDGQWEGCFTNPNFTFYALKSDETVLGYGAIGKMRYNENNVDIGNFTLPEYRRKGVGRSLIINMAKIAISKGYIPTAGCWYGNSVSVRTLKSSGFMPENRIFYVRFK